MTERATNRVYIAYGSNMDIGQMAFRCPGARVLGRSELEGWRLAFRGRPGNANATIQPEAGARTPVLVWAISERHEATLDIYEGVEGGYYYKHYLPVTVDGRTYEGALVYIMTPQPYNLPSRRYFDGIAAGYRDAGIGPGPLHAALETARELQGKEVK